MTQEIRTLKLKYRMAILAIIGTMIAFVIGNLADIKAIFYPAPTIKIVTKDTFLKQHGALKIYKTSSDPERIFLETSVRAATNWLILDPGAYRVVVQVSKIVRFDKQVVLNSGDKELFVIDRNPNQIQLNVVNNVPRPYPGATLQLQVNSSGNGYLWIYELADGNQFQRHYPPTGAATERHSIYAGKPFTLPDKQNYGIQVGKKTGEENLLFVVTSTHDVSIADAIAARMAGANTKASGGDVRENWGIHHLNYTVEF